MYKGLIHVKTRKKEPHADVQYLQYNGQVTWEKCRWLWLRERYVWCAFPLWLCTFIDILYSLIQSLPGNRLKQLHLSTALCWGGGDPPCHIGIQGWGPIYMPSKYDALGYLMSSVFDIWWVQNLINYALLQNSKSCWNCQHSSSLHHLLALAFFLETLRQ